MNYNSNSSSALIKSRSKTSKIVNKVDDSLPLYKKIEEIISTGKKDTGRLHHILSTLKENKFLYKSDQQYLDECLLDFSDSEKKIQFTSKSNLLFETSADLYDDLGSENIVPVNYVQTHDSTVNVDVRKYPENDISTVMHSIELLSNKIEDL